MAALGAARCAMLVAPEPVETPTHLPNGRARLLPSQRQEHIRVLASTKNNLGPRPDSLRFSLDILKDGVARIHWLGPSPLTADDLLVLDSVAEGKGAAAQAEKFLHEFLKDSA